MPTHHNTTSTTCTTNTTPGARIARPARLAAGFAGTFLLALAACGVPSRGAAAGVNQSGGPQVITVRATEFAFSEKTIRVPSGRPVRLVVDNAGLIEHDLTVAGLPATGVRPNGAAHGHNDEVAAHAVAGKRAWVEFTATKKGTYDVECSIPGHKEAGMRATLVVE